jgi:hypothetical protein
MERHGLIESRLLFVERGKRNVRCENDADTCPLCGLPSERKKVGVGHAVRDPPRDRPSKSVRYPGFQTPAANDSFDRLMSWAVGVLLIAFIAALVVFQVNFRP